LSTRNLTEGTLFEVLQKALDTTDKPLDTDRTEGRFMALCEGYLDPAVYSKGRQVTLAGRVLGTRIDMVGEITYVYPLLACLEVYLWPPMPDTRMLYPYGLLVAMVQSILVAALSHPSLLIDSGSPSALQEEAMRWHWLSVLASLRGCVACSSMISPQAQSLTDPELSYAQLASNPEAYMGKVVIIAGIIIEAVNTREDTRLLLLQYPANRRGCPQSDTSSGGRFLVLTPEYLETAIYRAGRALTVAGEVWEPRGLPGGETVYRYPLLAPREMYLWPEGDGGSPLFHVGFGFGFSKSL
jgi:outer membrane lipoprotein